MSYDSSAGNKEKGPESRIQIVLKQGIKPEQFLDYGIAWEDSLGNLVSRDVAGSIVNAFGSAIMQSPNDYFSVSGTKGDYSLSLKESASDLLTQLIRDHDVKGQIDTQQAKVKELFQTVMDNMTFKQGDMSGYFAFRVSGKDYESLDDAISAASGSGSGSQSSKASKAIKYGLAAAAILALIYAKDCGNTLLEKLGYGPKPNADVPALVEPKPCSPCYDLDWLLHHVPLPGMTPEPKSGDSCERPKVEAQCPPKYEPKVTYDPDTNTFYVKCDKVQPPQPPPDDRRGNRGRQNDYQREKPAQTGPTQTDKTPSHPITRPELHPFSNVGNNSPNNGSDSGN